MSLLWHPDQPGLLWVTPPDATGSGLTMDPNCCCLDEHCPCLTGRVVANAAIPIPPARTVGPFDVLPCWIDEGLFFGSVNMSSTADFCVAEGLRYEIVYTGPPNWTPINGCNIAPGLGSCSSVDWWIPNPSRDPVPDCRPLVAQCPSGQTASTGSWQRFILSVDCTDELNIVSQLTYIRADFCFGSALNWHGIMNHGPGPIDPADILGLYTLTPNGPNDVLPLPDEPYSHLRWVPQSEFDLRNGYQVLVT